MLMFDEMSVRVCTLGSQIWLCVCHLGMCSCINFLTQAQFPSGNELADDTITVTTDLAHTWFQVIWEMPDSACVVNHASCCRAHRVPRKSKEKWK